MDQPPRFRLLATLAVMFGIDLVVFMDRAVLAAVLVPIQERFELTDTSGGMLLSVYSISYCATLPFIGWLSDRLPRRYLLAVGIGIWSVMSLATGLAQSWEQLLVVRCLTGIGEATCAPIGPALVADCFPRSQRSRALALLFAAIPIGSALGYAVGGQAAVWLDWRWAFYATGLFGMMAACLALTMDETTQDSEAKVETNDTWTNVKSLLHNQAFLFTTLGMALMVFTLVGLNAWAPKFLVKNRGMSLDDADTALGVLVAVAGIGGAVLGGWLGGRLGGRGPSALMGLVSVATLTAMPFLAVALWTVEPMLILASIGIGLTLICVNVAPLDSVLIAVTAPKTRGFAFAVNVLVIHLLGEMPAPYVVGAVSDASAGLVWGLALTVATLFLAGLVYCLSARILSPPGTDS